MAWEESPRICLHMQLIAILSRTGVKYCLPNAKFLVIIIGMTQKPVGHGKFHAADRLFVDLMILRVYYPRIAYTSIFIFLEADANFMAAFRNRCFCSLVKLGASF